MAPVAWRGPGGLRHRARSARDPTDFVYRYLDNTSLEIVSGTSDARHQPGHRDGADAERSRRASACAATSRSGRRPPCRFAAAGSRTPPAHPDAGKVWSFGSYQPAADRCRELHERRRRRTTIRLTSAADAQDVHGRRPGETADLWVIQRGDAGRAQRQPDAGSSTARCCSTTSWTPQPVVAECPEATGREVPATELPFVQPDQRQHAASSASGATYPPLTDFCFIAALLFGSGK